MGKRGPHSKIAPDGHRRRVEVIVSDTTHAQLLEESRRTGRTMGAIVRDRIAAGAQDQQSGRKTA